MAHHVIDFDEQCKPCGGTGLYIGLAERDGAAVVCYQCKGTGKAHFHYEYEDFEARAVREQVRRVFATAAGICIGEGNEHALTDFGGLSYDEWLALPVPSAFPPFTEMRNFTCPAHWYQLVDYERKPDWDECLGCGAFRNCEHFAQKCVCWARWDAQFGVEEKQHA